MAGLELVSAARCFGGFQKVFKHHSKTTKCDMKFAVYLPPQTESQKVPVLYWLSGLTCTEQNFILKSGFQRYAAEYGIIVVSPDTSPRGCNITGEDDSWDFGTGAGFYVDATDDKWKENYNMFSYVTQELPQIVSEKFPILPGKQSICGHSMGGHGALICALRNPGMYKAVSAFAPIANPSICPWGIKAFTNYLGADKETWKQYDATELAKVYDGPPLHILIDQGKSDEFEANQLYPDNFVQACRSNNVPVILRNHDGYDHSFYFIASFIGEHFKHHSDAMKL